MYFSECDARRNTIKHFGPYHQENTPYRHYKYQLVNDAKGNDDNVFREQAETRKYTLWVKVT
jgi:hypothetical protein